MKNEEFKKFIKNSLGDVIEFVNTNKLNLVYGLPNEQQFDYIQDESPLSDEMLYSIVSPSNRGFYLRFIQISDNQFQILIDNGQISLMLDQNMQRMISYPNDELNQRIDNIKGNTKEKLITCLYILWDISCFIVFLSKEMENNGIHD